MEDYLQGRAGYEVIKRDMQRPRDSSLAHRGPRPADGLNVVLTVDQVIEHIAEQELEKAMARIGIRV